MSHHYSGPNLGFPGGDARLDFTDLYAFPKPGDPGKSILIMNVHPSASLSPPGPTTAEPFAPEALYELKIDTNGDAVADIAYRARFASADGGGQTATLRRAEGAEAAGTGDGGKVVVESAPVSMGRDARVAEAGDHRFFAGWRSDPFFFDAPGAVNNFQFDRRRFLRRQGRLQHRAGSAQLRSGAERGRPVGPHADPGEGRGRGLGPGGSRRATLANPIPERRAERGLSRRGAGGRRPFRRRLRARAGAYGRVCAGGRQASGGDPAAGPPALRPRAPGVLSR